MGEWPCEPGSSRRHLESTVGIRAVPRIHVVGERMYRIIQHEERQLFRCRTQKLDVQRSQLQPESGGKKQRHLPCLQAQSVLSLA